MGREGGRKGGKDKRREGGRQVGGREGGRWVGGREGGRREGGRDTDQGRTKIEGEQF